MPNSVMLISGELMKQYQSFLIILVYAVMHIVYKILTMLNITASFHYNFIIFARASKG